MISLFWMKQQDFAIVTDELIGDNLKTTLTDSDSPPRPANLFFGLEVQGKTEMRVKELARIYFRPLEKIPRSHFFQCPVSCSYSG